ncbi:MAG: redox-regulated ATPase YchF [Vampirovibrionales bacterium]|nr:redox-regulated ATPase YchF [Vampirovibrionales bacterium]
MFKTSVQKSPQKETAVRVCETLEQLLASSSCLIGLYMLRAGIVGLPNVGKSTLFNALTATYAAESANYPFCTIEPNKGIVWLPDPRIDVLQKMVQTDKTVPAAFEFVDIAGLVRGASKGEGLGNQFLANIREVDVIVHVVRCFEDDNITHVDGGVDPVRDVETIMLELCLADMGSLEKRIERLNKAKKSHDKDALMWLALFEKIQPVIDAGQWVHLSGDYSPQEQSLLKQSQLLCVKPVVYAANVSEADLATPHQNKYFQALQQFADAQGAPVIAISAQIEAELNSLDDAAEKAEYLKGLGVDTSGVDRLIRATFDRLGLATYFTAGKMEVRAWPFPKGYRAPQCAGIIHGDFEKGFIRAEVIGYDDYVACGGEAGAKAKGLMRLEGKDYAMADGDVVHFRFNV